MKGNIISLDSFREKGTLTKLREEICSAISLDTFSYGELIAIGSNSGFCGQIFSKIQSLGIKFRDYNPCFLDEENDGDVFRFRNRYPDTPLPPNKTLKEICEMRCDPIDVLLKILQFCDSYLQIVLDKDHLGEESMLKCIEQALVTRGYNFSGKDNIGWIEETKIGTSNNAMACLG